MISPPSNADLRIADLPPDLRAEGEILRDHYHALAADAGLLTANGAMDLGKLGDLAFVKAADMGTLRTLASAAEALERLGDVPRREYAELLGPFRDTCSFEEFCSPVFTTEASSHGFSRIQWLHVRAVVRQCAGKITPSTFLPEGLKDLKVVGDLDLRECSALVTLPPRLTVTGYCSLHLCTSLTSLPAGLIVAGTLDLTYCTALTAMPAKLAVGGDVYCEGCIGAVITEIKRLKAARRITGQVISR